MQFVSIPDLIHICLACQPCKSTWIWYKDQRITSSAFAGIVPECIASGKNLLG